MEPPRSGRGRRLVGQPSLPRILVVLLALLAGLTESASASAGATAWYVYDAPPIARLGVHAFDSSEASSPLLSGGRTESAKASVEAQGTSTTPSAPLVATEASEAIKTPYGVAEQGTDAGSIALRGQVESGGTVYRQGVTGTQQTAEGQFWAGQNPASTPGYANSYRTPGTQVAQGEYSWLMGGTVEPGTPFVTRGAPGIGTNLGGAPEVVVNPGGVRNLWFHMPD